MANSPPPQELSTQVLTYTTRRETRERHLLNPLSLITEIPKLELHIHIEGTLTPSLCFRLAQKHSISLTSGPSKHPLPTLSAVQEAYTQIRGRIGAASVSPSESTLASTETQNREKCFTFFEIYYGGFDLLRDEDDFFDLAVGYFKRAEEMNVRYSEVFFDGQGHTRRGIGMDVIMNGFRRAQGHAEEHFKVKSQWIMCILRDMSPESAIEAYEAALPYKDMIVGIGLDSDELDRPSNLFDALFKRARADGFKITSHCDFNQKNTHEHIRQVAEELGGSGADRIDHGLNAADREELVKVIKEKEAGMTVCPCAYVRHTAEREVFLRIRKLFDEGIKIAVASDDPAYMEDNWVLHNLYLVQEKCRFADHEMIQLQRNAVEICWASDALKQELTRELDNFERACLKY
ncbi:hypothetical protein BKA65DRAFT_507443 [Rhexocercosporidium sp. MPI-PUGE-AT-0058]|nr:hypothetical protein BKA65DRAFT_507443 [Rhexocercosporidium sp. MPI-PUGE-AT-0058]